MVVSGQLPDELDASSILVVEDEVLIRMAVTDYLRDCGFHVIEAANAEEAMAVLTSQVRVDLVCTDIQMPGSMDGADLVRWIRKERPGLPVIMVSGIAQSASIAADLCAEGPLVSKPYGHAELEQHIRSLIRSARAGGGLPGEGDEAPNPGAVQ